ncbi:hypothetical protein [Methanobrevibacter filiformis]|nr:hypothetical protein [Methanobrevibacter filiformis]
MKLGLILIVLSAIIYSANYLIFRDIHEVVFYILIDMAFVPLDILIVALVIEGVIAKKEKESIFEKLDMLMSVFFSEIGTDLIKSFSKIDQDNDKIKNLLEELKNKDDKGFLDILNLLKNKINHRFSLKLDKNDRKEYLTKLQEILVKKRYFLVRMLENPVLLEKENFSEVIMAIFHLDEELERRENFEEISEPDLNHILHDIDRAYYSLVYEWVSYLYYLKHHYPYIFALSMRTNPFDENAKVEIE